MSALLLALVLSIILDQGSGSQRIAGRLGEQFGATAAVIGGLTIAVVGNVALAALTGGILGALMPANARLLFFACTLSLGGVGLLLATMRSRRAPDAEAASLSPLRMIGTLAFRRAGENATLAVAGIALFTQAPVLTALGAIMGALSALLAALFAGRRCESILPTKFISIVAGTILVSIAIALAARALGLTGT